MYSGGVPACSACCLHFLGGATLWTTRKGRDEGRRIQHEQSISILQKRSFRSLRGVAASRIIVIRVGVIQNAPRRTWRPL